MSTITVNGAVVMSASITLPYYGAWVADVVLAASTTIANPVSIVVGDLTLTGTVRRQASSTGSRSARIVGGYGGWRNTIPAKGYASPVGVSLSTVLIDAAADAGEKINIPASSNRVLGNNWGREKDKAERVLHLLVGRSWWVDPSGVTQITARSSSPIVTPFMVTSWSGAKGKFDIAAEALASWQPGRTFTAATVSGTQTISSVTITADNDGKLRLSVLSTSGNTDRLRDDIRSMIRAEIATLTYSGTWEYKITASLGLGLSTKVDATPTAGNMPALTAVPLAAGVGVVSAPIAGTACRIRFVNSDPSRPEVVSMAATTEHLMTTEACALLIYNVLVALTIAMNINPLPQGASTTTAGALALVLQPLITPALLTAMAAQAVPAPVGLIAQATGQATAVGAMVAATAVSAAIGPLIAGQAAISAKLPDVSGFYPGLGVPNG